MLKIFERDHASFSGEFLAMIHDKEDARAANLQFISQQFRDDSGFPSQWMHLQMVRGPAARHHGDEFFRHADVVAFLHASP